MKIQKLFFITLLLSIITLQIKAQLKVFTTGEVSIGGNSIVRKLHVLGDGVFSSTTSFTSAAYIRGTNSNSTATTPEYTWWNDDNTGFFHPATYAIGISIGGVERMRITNNQVGIHTTSPSSALSVGGSGNALWKGYFYNSSTSNGAQGLRAEVATPTGSNTSYAASSAITCGTGYAYGFYGSSYNSTAQSAGQAYGIQGLAGNATSGYNYGVWGKLSGSNNGSGIYGTDDVNGATNVSGKYAGYFAGKLYATSSVTFNSTLAVTSQITTSNDSPGKPTAGSWWGTSDSRLKKNITDFKDGLNVLRHVRPVNYQYNGIGDLPVEETYIGVVAQEIQQVAPYTVRYGKLAISDKDKANFKVIDTIKGNIVNKTDSAAKSITTSIQDDKYIAEVLNYSYDGLIYVMINSIKQLDSTVTELQKVQQKSDSLSQQLEDMKSHINQYFPTNPVENSTGSINTNNQKEIQKVILESANAIILYQNEPNPFGNSTIIRYYVSERTKEAILVFYDEFGREISRESLQQKGYSKVDINSEKLASGIYTYSIIADGKTADTKKMLKIK